MHSNKEAAVSAYLSRFETLYDWGLFEDGY